MKEEPATEISMERWKFFHAGGLILTGSMVVLREDILPVLLFMSLSMGYYILKQHHFLKTFHPYGGYANLVTLLRIVTVLLTGLKSSTLHPYLILLVLIMVLIFDGVDGYLARKYNTSSRFGQVFDLETDNFFTLILCSILYLNGYVPWWIILSGLLSYGYVMADYLLDWSTKKVPANRHARVLSVIVFSTYFTPFVFPYMVYFPLVVLGTVLLAFSFGYSIFLRYR